MASMDFAECRACRILPEDEGLDGLHCIDQSCRLTRHPGSCTGHLVRRQIKDGSLKALGRRKQETGQLYANSRHVDTILHLKLP